MLFAVKRRLMPTLLTLVAFVALALAARAAWELRWRLEAYPALPLHALLALAGMVACDGVVYGALCRLYGDRYLTCQRCLAGYFAAQRLPEMAAGSLLAAAEELLFRGVVLEALTSRLGLSPALAILLSAVLFGALHFLRDPRLRPFALWAVGQGLILGSLYVATGSLLLVMLVHAAHDGVGFALLAHQRREATNVKGKRDGGGELSQQQ